MKATGGSSAKVKTIFWEEDDQSFYTGSSDGQVLWWRLEDAGTKSESIFMNPSFNVTSICSYVHSSIEKYIYISGTWQNHSMTANEKCMFQVKVNYEKDKDSSSTH